MKITSLGEQRQLRQSGHFNLSLRIVVVIYKYIKMKGSIQC